MIKRIGVHRLIVFALIILYVVIFAWLAFDLHTGMRTHKSDLGQMDQAVWNTSQGRFLESIQKSYVSTRLTDHVEPIFALIAPVFWLWDDVRAILLLQVIFVALGAWPLFELARRKSTANIGLALVVAYLLNPQLQSAVLTEFHAIPLSVPFILWAFWAVETERWGRFLAAALLLAMVKEEAALLAAGLGLWAIWRTYLSNRRVRPKSEERQMSARRGYYAGILVTALSFLWFYTATFVIVPAYASQVYGTAQSSYFQRYGVLGNTPLDIIKSFFTRPQVVLQIAAEPARVGYVLMLLAAFGFLSLLAPDVLLVSLPVLLANLLSAYPAQYYGEFHYTAPLVPFFAAAAAYGTGRANRWLARKTRGKIEIILAIWLVVWAGFVYVQAGRGPWGGRYDPTPITAHHRLLDRFVTQIPVDAAVTATAAVHPHLSHRRYIYQFPHGLEAPGRADWALIDVTTNTDMAPGDVRTTVEAMLAGDWGVVDGADGFLLLSKSSSDKVIPDAFFDFVRVRGDAEAPVGPLVFADISVADWPRWRATKVITEWMVGPDYQPGAVRPWLELRTPDGRPIFTLDELTPPALVWYPTNLWQPGDRITIETLPLYLPRYWGGLVGAVHGPNPAESGDRLPISMVAPMPGPLPIADGTLALVAAYRREADVLVPIPLEALTAPDFGAQIESEARQTGGRFRTPDGGDLYVTAWLPPGRVRPGDTLDLWLRWSNALPEGYIPFIHIRQDDANLTQSDGPPTVFFPTFGDGPANDWRQLSLPDDLEPGTILTVVAGVYDPSNGNRLDVLTESGQPQGNELVLGVYSVAPPKTPDQTCSLIPDTCDAQP